MDIVERLRRTELHHVWDDLEGKMVGKMFSANPDGPEAADEIERLRRALKTFADNVRKTNSGIDKNWAKTIYPLKAENQRLRGVLQKIADIEHEYIPAPTTPNEANVWTVLAMTIGLAEKALKEGE